ncbi:DUF6712 family protein [Prevotella sp.]|uniref:DUF6712 family protein n=1 Tax=Prevotella sp. TaxID=59823 RepID=UPI0025CC7945|nr:DUF6712 family protein [Prevotella sp.]
MILSTTKELRLHIPSNAIDEISSLQGILDNSEKDFLRDKLGDSLYNRLCEYYQTVSPDDFYMAVCNGENTQHPWMQLLLMAQRMVTYDAMSRFVYTQALSINGTGINVASSDDYGTASKDLLDKGVQGYKREAMVSLNQMLVMLEGWAKKMATPAPIADADTIEQPTEPKDEEHKAIEEISLLWQESQYYYLHHDLLIATCADLQHYLDIYESREKFIRLLPDLHFIQDEYISEAIGEDTVQRLLHTDDPADKPLLRKVRRLMVAHLEERTTILTIDKARRAAAHNEAISLRSSVLRLMEMRKAADVANATPDKPSTNTTDSTSKGYENNQPDSKIFVSPLLY